jgi:hypothetical protein
LSICERESGSKSQSCAISAEDINVTKLCVASPWFTAKERNHVIPLATALPYVRKIIGTYDLEFDATQWIKQSSLSVHVARVRKFLLKRPIGKVKAKAAPTKCAERESALACAPELAIERASSGCATCCVSNEVIPKGTLRLKIIIIKMTQRWEFPSCDPTRYADPETFLKSLSICKRESGSESQSCAISAEYIKVGEFYVAFTLKERNRAIPLATALPYVRKIIGTCDVEFDATQWITQSSLSEEDQQEVEKQWSKVSTLA